MTTCIKWCGKQDCLNKCRQDVLPLEKPDPVSNPSHYKAGGLEAINVIEAFAPGNFHRGNALKYLLRAGKKDGGDTVQDLRKALWYIEREIGLSMPGYQTPEDIANRALQHCRADRSEAPGAAGERSD